MQLRSGDIIIIVLSFLIPGFIIVGIIYFIARYSDYKKRQNSYMNLIINEKLTSINELARRTNTPINIVVEELHRLANSGMLQASIDAKNGTVRLINTLSNKTPVIRSKSTKTTCPSCGAGITSNNTHCEYCGGEIK